ncbi:hypothetical protein [Trueperella sp. LYQ141]|uniref:hypothetical protein n=1 Tax=Trueperella sp. LYQ141 TaxID=3391058 RepID=UPI00398315F6
MKASPTVGQSPRMVIFAITYDDSMGIPGSEEVALSRPRAIYAWMRCHGWLFRPLLLLAVLVTLGVVTFFLFDALEPGSYPAQINSAIIGSLVTVFIAFSVAIVALWSQFAQRHDARRLERVRHDSRQRRAIQVGRMRIPDIIAIRSARKGVDLREICPIEWHWNPDPRPLSDDARREVEAVLPSLQEKAEKRGVVLTNGPRVDLVRAIPFMKTSTQEVKAGGRKDLAGLRLEVSSGEYFDFVSTAARLEAKAAAGEGTVREFLNVHIDCIEEIHRLPFLASMGSGTVVLTKDQQLVVGIRGNTYIASGARSGDYAVDSPRKVHFIAEGMLPDDISTADDPSEIASRRGLEEELNIGLTRGCTGRVVEHAATGFFLDTLRMQPCFSYFAQIDQTFDELHTCHVMAPDSWEASNLVALPFSLERRDMRQLLLGSHPDYELASNHAAAMLWFALIYRFGFTAVRDYLTTPFLLEK